MWVRFRVGGGPAVDPSLAFQSFNDVMTARIREADEFYAAVQVCVCPFPFPWLSLSVICAQLPSDFLSTPTFSTWSHAFPSPHWFLKTKYLQFSYFLPF